MEGMTEYGYWQDVPTRWKDNDHYGHVNNAVHYSVMDTVINTWLIERAGLELDGDGPIGLCVESHCSYKASVSFPEVIAVGLRVGHLGTSSVRYETGLYRSDRRTLVAEGTFTHVFVDRETRRPEPIAGTMRDELAKLLTSSRS
jgi:acyl-CoA thioester hydrolase